jgi:putative hydrolase of the HAD superfamily
VTRAVVFDPFETLVDYDDAWSRDFSSTVARLCGRDPEDFHAEWIAGRRTRDIGPMGPYLASLGIEEGSMQHLLEQRRAWSRGILNRPREGVVETMNELRRREIGTGLITVCSEDVVDVWPETPFCGLFDAEVFSCSCGLSKPDPRIYGLALEKLGVESSDALFVGDGANDELAGAERVGMPAVLIHRRGEEPALPAVRDWTGARITRIPEVLEYL